METQAQDVQLAMRGDEAAYTRLINTTARLVTSLALSIVRDLDASEDVAQQVYISLWQKIATLKNPASFLPWLRESTRHAAYNYLRDHRVVKRVGGDEGELLLAELQDPGTGPEVAADRERTAALLAALVAALPEDSREVVLLYYREEQDTAHVAALLGLSEDNVRQRLARARTLLRMEILEKYGSLLALTLPSLGFMLATGAMLGASSPAAAALGSSMLGKQSGILAKLLFVLGGALIGTMAALLGVFAGFAPLLKRAPTGAIRQELLRIRRNGLVFMCMSGLAFAASYEVSAGWMLPLFTYTLFYASVAYVVTHIVRISRLKEYEVKPLVKTKFNGSFWGPCFGYAGMVLGGLGGYAGLIVGLANAGRF